MNVLAPYFARLFALMMEKAQISEMWKAAKVAPLHKRVPVLDPNNYRMLAVSGTMYRLYTNVLRVYVTEWCQKNIKIPDTQFGFYPGRNTLQPMFILRHLLHAAQTKKPHGSPRLHAAFIDFKQAYDSIPRCALWEHLQRNCMPTCLLKIIQMQTTMCWWMELSKQGYGLLMASNNGALFHLCFSLCTSMMLIA